MKTDFNPESDIPNLEGKVFLITGGTAGLGRETLLQLAKHKPAHLFFTGRNQASADALISSIHATVDPDVKTTFLRCDFGSRDSVARAAAAFRAASERLDVLVASAGLMAAAPGLTGDGYEVQFGTAHMGHFTLLKLLLPVLLSTAAEQKKKKTGEGAGAGAGDGADVRVVALTSLGYALHPCGGIAFEELKTEMARRNTWVRYGQAKLANILMVKELARRYTDSGITSVVVHPGTVKTGLVDGLGWGKKAFVYATNPGGLMTVEQGARNMLWAATTAGGELKSGQFYLPVGKEGDLVRDGEDMELAKRLWEWSEREIDGLELS